MGNIQAVQERKGAGNARHYLLCAVAAVPVYLIANSYVQTVMVHDNEQVATAATMSFLGGVYIGRYLSFIWASHKKDIPSFIFIALSLFITGNIVWLFFHADFPLQGRQAINLLLFWLSFFLMSIALGMLVKLTRMQIGGRLQEARAVAEHSRSELHLLQSQLSPHFLFNTLNNLYGLSITQHEKIPPLLLRLSDLLRYSVYDAKELFVPLKAELEYIRNYIEFEKIRMGERLELTTSLEPITGTQVQVAPMLLIVFIENAFKHSKNTADQKVFIDIALKTWGSYILFSIKNSYAPVANDKNAWDKNSGIGLPNVTKRLELLYPKQYSLELEEKNGFYNVMLQLKQK